MSARSSLGISKWVFVGAVALAACSSTGGGGGESDDAGGDAGGDVAMPFADSGPDGASPGGGEVGDPCLGVGDCRSGLACVADHCATASSKDPIRIFSGHTARVHAVAFSPDGKKLLTGSWDYTSKLWDVASGAAIATLPQQGPVNSVTFSPDGTKALTGGTTVAKLWDVSSATEIHTFSRGNLASWNVLGVAFSPHADRIVTSYDALSGDTGNNVAILWSTAGDQVRTFAGHSDWVWAVAFSPDGTQLLTASGDHTAKLWNADTGAEIRTFSGHTDALQAAAFSPDGTRLLTGSADFTMKLWDVATGGELHTFVGTSGNEFRGVAFSPDGTKIAAAVGPDLEVWSASTFAKLARFSDPGQGALALAYAPDGKTIATGHYDQVVRLWDVSGLAP